jgi:hypothetical protein
MGSKWQLVRTKYILDGSASVAVKARQLHSQYAMNIPLALITLPPKRVQSQSAR